MCVSLLVVDVHVIHMLVCLLWLGLHWCGWLVLLGGACGLAGMVLMVLGYVLRSATFGWTGATGSLPMCVKFACMAFVVCPFSSVFCCFG
jgi:hypothetical protein